MGTEKKYLNYRSFSSVSRYGAIAARLLFALALILETVLLLDDPISGRSMLIAAALLVSLLGLSVMQLLNLANINRRSLLPGLIDDAIILCFFVFLTPPSSWYVLVWVLAVIRSDFESGTRGAILTTSLGIVSILLKGLYIYGDFSSLQSEELLIQSVILSALAIAVVTMRTTTDKERKILMVSMDKAQLERQRLVSLVNSMNDAVIALDFGGEINMYNGSALALLDTNAALDDRNLKDVATFFDEKGDKVDILALAENSNTTIDRRDLSLVFGENDKVNLRVTLSPIKLSFRSSSDRGFILTMRDITKEKSLEEERNEFISVVSHELRTPITVTEGEISNAMFMNEKNSNDEVVQGSLQSAHKQIVFLANMVNDLATLSRAERDDVKVDIDTIDIKDLMSEIKRNYEVDAKGKGLWLETEIREDPGVLLSNHLYVKEIIQNFVTNSIKYTKNGGITVVAEKVGKELRFDVNDTGIGISKADQKKLFEKFFRSEDFRTRESGGTGLGLYVTQKLAMKIGARIEVSSELNKGSTFSLIVPYKVEGLNDRETKQNEIEQLMG